MKKKRIVVTGLGSVSCFGTDVNTFFDKLLQGESGVREITEFDISEYPTRFAANVAADFDVGDYMDKKQARRVDPFIRYAMVAGKKALEDAKLSDETLNELDKKKIGVIIGSGMGGMEVFSDGVRTVYEKGFKRLTPFFIPYIITNMAGALLAIDKGFMGPNYSISTACATANYSIVAAAEHIRSGQADVMVCGGSEAAINPIGLSGFVAIKALSTRNDEPTAASRPWDKERDGFVMGSGCGVIILESLEHALKRGAPIYAEYLGGSTNCDAHHMTDPKPDGSVVGACIQSALDDAAIKPEEVNYVNAHGTSTLAGDLCEIRALRNVFKEHTKNIKVNSTKSMIGHCLGAAGGLEAVAVVKSIETGKIHPTINLKNPEDEVADIDLVPGHAKEHKITAALSNSFGFGGHNSTLVFAPYAP